MAWGNITLPWRHGTGNIKKDISVNIYSAVCHDTNTTLRNVGITHCQMTLIKQHRSQNPSSSVNRTALATDVVDFECLALNSRISNVTLTKFRKSTQCNSW